MRVLVLNQYFHPDRSANEAAIVELCEDVVLAHDVTVYCEQGKEDHEVIAMIARAFIPQSPFIVWGDGRQMRNPTRSVMSR